MKAAAHRGAFRDTFLMSEVFLEKKKKPDWYKAQNLNSHDAVLDLFNFCIVLYVRFRYFLEFTFAILGFLLLAKTILKKKNKNNGEKRVTVFLKGGYFHGWITLGVFWGVCTCSNSIYTTIPMPLYSYLVSPVSGNLELIHNNSYFGESVHWEGHRGLESYCCYSHWNSLWWSLWILLSLPAVLLNTSWDNAMLCSWYKKHLFLEAWLALRNIQK